MKRRMLALLLAVLMLAMLTAAAFAEDTVLGVYNVTGPLTVLNGTKNGSFYADANEFELNCSGLTGEYSLVLLLEGDSPVPTDGNIQYIDQMSIANGAVKFKMCIRDSPYVRGWFAAACPAGPETPPPTAPARQDVYKRQAGGIP